MFDFSELVCLILDYGFNNFFRDSGISMARLVDVFDGVVYLSLKEVDIISTILKIPDIEQDRIFFTKKVDTKQL